MTNPHHRRSIRLPGYDYRQPGAYFVTVCTEGHECFLGEVKDQRVILSHEGRVIAQCWRDLPQHFPGVELGAFVVMPNHVHAIIRIVEAAGEGEDGDPHAPEPGEDGDPHAPEPGEATGAASRALTEEGPDAPDASPLRMQRVPPDVGVGEAAGAQSGSLGAMVQNLKSVTTRRINRLRRTPGAPVWQRNYYEHVIRNEDEAEAIAEYIVTNPERWDLDEDNPANRVVNAQNA